MSSGLGIFLSSLFLGTIALYGITKDRWNWRRIGRNISLGLLVIAIAGAGVYFWNDLVIQFSIFRQTEVPIPKQTEYGGLRLGMTQDEVIYVKGYPPIVLGEPDAAGPYQGSRPLIAGTELEKGKRLEDYQEWSYDMGQINVDFGPAKTGLIVITCHFTDYLKKKCPAIGGITDGNTEQEVIKKFGKPDTASIEGVTKFFYYKNIGVQFWLQQEQVYMIGIIGGDGGS